MIGLGVTAGVLLAAAVAGNVYQRGAEARLRAKYPAPGRLIDVGGRRLHLDCRGSGPGPTVILEAGAGNFSVQQRRIQARVADWARVCTYDRAGYGWSDPAPAGRNLLDRVHDLHALLHLGEVPGPYVLVGHSMGGVLARLYQQRYPQDVAGLVLLEAGEPAAMFGKPVGKTLATMGLGVRAASAAVAVGLAPVINLFGAPLRPPKDQPPETALGLLPGALGVRAEDLAVYGKPPARYLPTDLRPGVLGDLPLAVVRSAGRRDSQGKTQAALSRRGVFIAAERSGHNVNLDRPDVCAEAVRKVWEMAREPS